MLLNQGLSTLIYSFISLAIFSFCNFFVFLVFFLIFLSLFHSFDSFLLFLFFIYFFFLPLFCFVLNLYFLFLFYFALYLYFFIFYSRMRFPTLSRRRRQSDSRIFSGRLYVVTCHGLVNYPNDPRDSATAGGFASIIGRWEFRSLFDYLSR